MRGNGKVFISHASADSERCVPLLAALDAWGVDYWFDNQQLDPGDTLSPTLQRAIAERDIFLRVCSPATLRSYWMDLEVGAFRGLQAETAGPDGQGERFLINLIVAPGYEREPFDFATTTIDAADRPQRAWLAELRAALGLAVLEEPVPAGSPGAPARPPVRGPLSPPRPARPRLPTRCAAVALLAGVVALLAASGVAAAGGSVAPFLGALFAGVPTARPTLVPTPSPTATPTPTPSPIPIPPTPTPPAGFDSIYLSDDFQITFRYPAQPWYVQNDAPPGPYNPGAGQVQIESDKESVTTFGHAEMLVIEFAQPSFSADGSDLHTLLESDGSGHSAVEVSGTARMQTINGVQWARREYLYTDTSNQEMHYLLLTVQHNGHQYVVRFDTMPESFAYHDQREFETILSTLRFTK